MLSIVRVILVLLIANVFRWTSLCTSQNSPLSFTKSLLDWKRSISLLFEASLLDYFAEQRPCIHCPVEVLCRVKGEGNWILGSKSVDLVKFPTLLSMFYAMICHPMLFVRSYFVIGNLLPFDFKPLIESS